MLIVCVKSVNTLSQAITFHRTINSDVCNQVTHFLRQNETATITVDDNEAKT